MRTIQISVVVVSIGLLSGCGHSSTSDDPSSPTPPRSPQRGEQPPPTTAGSTSTPSEPAARDTELTGAVEAFWRFYLELVTSSGPFDPVGTRERLAEFTTGAELELLFDFIQGNSLAGYAVRGDIESSPTVVTEAETRAEVRDCYDDTTGLYRLDTDERLDTDTPERHQVLFVFEKQDGVWKVKEVRDEGDGCVVSS